MKCSTKIMFKYKHNIINGFGLEMHNIKLALLKYNVLPFMFKYDIGHVATVVVVRKVQIN